MLGDGYVGIDLDKCITRADGKALVADWTKTIARHQESYTEKSPSGTGLHILARGTASEQKAGDAELYGAGDKTPFELNPAPKSIAARAHIASPKLKEVASRNADTPDAGLTKRADRIGKNALPAAATPTKAARADDDDEAAVLPTLSGRPSPLRALNKLALRAAELWLPKIMPDTRLKGETWRATAPGTSSENFSLHPTRGAT